MSNDYSNVSIIQKFAKIYPETLLELKQSMIIICDSNWDELNI